MAKQIITGVLFIIAGVLIDSIQACTMLIMTSIGLMSGTIGGCEAGQAVAGSVGCAVGGFFGTFANPFLAIGAVPVAIGMGMILSVIASIMLGTPLLFTMWTKKYLYSIPATFTFVSETIPGVDFFPGWTVFAATSVLRKTGEVVAGSVVSSVQGTLTTLGTGKPRAGNDNFSAGNDNGATEGRSVYDQEEPGVSQNKNERTPIRLVR